MTIAKALEALTQLQRSNKLPNELIAPAIAKFPFRPPPEFLEYLEVYGGGVTVENVEFLALDVDPMNPKKTWDSMVRNSDSTDPPSIVFAKGGGSYFFLIEGQATVCQGFDDGEWGDIDLSFSEFVLDLIEQGGLR